MLQENRQCYLDWAHDLLAESLSFARVLKYTQVLMTFERFLKKPFQEATKKDLQEAVINLDYFGYNPHYLHDIKITVRKFYKWLKVTVDSYPEEVRWIPSVLRQSQRRMLPESLLSEEQILQMLDACRSIRDRGRWSQKPTLKSGNNWGTITCEYHIKSSSTVQKKNKDESTRYITCPGLTW